MAVENENVRRILAGAAPRKVIVVPELAGERRRMKARLAFGRAGPRAGGATRRPLQRRAAPRGRWCRCCAASRWSVDSRADRLAGAARAWWTGSMRAARRPPPRRRARRYDHRFRHPRDDAVTRERRTLRAPLPVRRRRARHRPAHATAVRRRRRRRFLRNATVAAEQTALERLLGRVRRPDRRRGSPCMRRACPANGAQRNEGEAWRGRAAVRRPRSFRLLLHGPRRIRQLRTGRGCRRGDRRRRGVSTSAGPSSRSIRRGWPTRRRRCRCSATSAGS